MEKFWQWYNSWGAYLVLAVFGFIICLTFYFGALVWGTSEWPLWAEMTIGSTNLIGSLWLCFVAGNPGGYFGFKHVLRLFGYLLMIIIGFCVLVLLLGL